MLDRNRRLLLTLAAGGLTLLAGCTSSVHADRPAADAQVTAVKAQPLSWAPPALENPVTFTITQENALRVRLDDDKDYILKFAEPIKTPGGVSITGGRNVVLIGGEIFIPHAGEYVKELQFDRKRRGLYVGHWKGTMHIEGLLIHGEDLAEAMNMDSRTPGSMLQLQNVRVENMHSRPEEIEIGWKGVNHPDVLQIWGGPTFLRVDGLTGETDYQGMFLQPNQFGKHAIEIAELRRINLRGINERGRYLLWLAGGDEALHEMRLSDVWIKPADRWAEQPTVWPHGAAIWKDVQYGHPPEGDFVPRELVGMNYQSPGYR